MAPKKNIAKKPESDRLDQRKERKCLMCGDMFLSEHAGERICRSCKGTAAWRSGYAA